MNGTLVPMGTGVLAGTSKISESWVPFGTGYRENFRSRVPKRTEKISPLIRIVKY